ncbi:MAG: branched-chain amino acid aminotransferase [Clostridiales bacterium]|jgi:branched-chain amino acid aminotransferase|nr:branched-chain amino acid aminotransferase [Clostridiales bacterium]MCI1960717.1 branched-chain amino acid aminotransferase [Clostridiales bacterium]MCI2021158.1 branched-chain amino acid aminotransferase [Clostridiales bacterium]MCI2025541.1 branched-chain amino acid aminotransferase [Clostridiales bacterium]
MQEIRVELTKNPKQKPAPGAPLPFGTIFSDHMFLMDYDKGKGWHDARIVPFGNLDMSPAAMCLHYGQSVFEGMKAYRAVDGRILLFRPDRNMARMNSSNDRLCIPQIDEKFAEKAIEKLVSVDKDWIPTSEGASLYIRPFIIGMDPHIGVHPANHLLFIVITCPVGNYYPEGLNPVKIYVEKNYVRAVRGGMGYTKTAGNYAASLKAQDEAEKQDYTQVLWLDGVERKYIEEVGTMNVFFKINGEVVTPELQGSILPGVTRMSVIEILKKWGVPVVERRLSIQELADAAKDGKLEEAFGSGTAAVISPIGHLKWGDDIMIINDGKIGELSQKLYDTLTGIQWGKIPDPFGWTVEVK